MNANMRKSIGEGVPRMGIRARAFNSGVFIVFSLLCLVSVGCSPSAAPVAVSGKTVYSGMGLEGIPLRVMRWTNGKWEDYTQTRSGYHGSFVVYLPEGKYLFTARTILRRSTVDLTLEGRLEGLEVISGAQRVDRVVIELKDGSQPKEAP